PSVQAKLLRVLQERAFERVGSSVTMGTDVRVIATSNRDLQEAIAKGAFRQDLYFRLNVLPITAPSLAERIEDVPMLAEHFSGEIAAREGRPPMRCTGAAIALLQSYRWPGNVRELQNICERAVVLSAPSGARGAGREIDAAMIEPWLRAPAQAPSAQVEIKTG